MTILILIFCAGCSFVALAAAYSAFKNRGAWPAQSVSDTLADAAAGAAAEAAEHPYRELYHEVPEGEPQLILKKKLQEKTKKAKKERDEWAETLSDLLVKGILNRAEEEASTGDERFSVEVAEVGDRFFKYSMRNCYKFPKVLPYKELVDFTIKATVRKLKNKGLSAAEIRYGNWRHIEVWW